MNVRTVMARFYKRANGDASKLPWYQKQPNDYVREFLPVKGKALDVGCGSGEHSVWLAGQGFDVTGIDMFDEAISMASELAAEHRVIIELLATDLFTFNREQAFDLVYDSGCLHSLVGGNRESYKQKVLQWLVPGGAFVLMHWGKRNFWDWRPIGPNRKSKESIVKMFEPEFQLERYHEEDFKVDFPFGPVVRGMCFKFTKK